MSSLIFLTEPEQAFVATDTLATSGADHGQPFMFTTKAFIVPHLRMIMCGVGVGGFLGKWFVEVNDRMVVRDIDHLDFHTPGNLAAFWLNFKETLSVPTNNFQTTVYHFGFSEKDGVIRSYAYRSTNDFKSEPRQYGLYVKPHCDVPNPYSFPSDIKPMMNEQRRIQGALPQNERIYIGGEIQIHRLSRKGFNVYTQDRFDDFEVDQKAIYGNYKT